VGTPVDGFRDAIVPHILHVPFDAAELMEFETKGETLEKEAVSKLVPIIEKLLAAGALIDGTGIDMEEGDVFDDEYTALHIAARCPLAGRTGQRQHNHHARSHVHALAVAHASYASLRGMQVGLGRGGRVSAHTQCVVAAQDWKVPPR
jgi:hypothetical protein